VNRKPVILLVLLLAPAIRGALEPGVEVVLDIPGGSGQMRVFTPTNHDAGKPAPVLFFYHGQGGQPTTQLPRQCTGDRDFLVVGMPYSGGAGDPANPDTTAAELLQFRRALSTLSGRVRIDRERVFLGGLSKGGWLAGLVGEAAGEDVAGWAILLAGRLRQPPPKSSLRGKAIYLGAGEHDPNMPSARRARVFYREQGARVSFEEYAGQGHRSPPVEALPVLQAWFAAQGRLRQPDESARETLRGWYTDTLEDAAAESDPLAQYHLLQAALNDPRMGRFGTDRQNVLRRQIQKLAARPPVRDEWRAQQDFDTLLAADYTIQRLDDMKEVRDGLRHLADQYSHTRIAPLAREEYQRVSEAYRRSLEATTRARSQAGQRSMMPPNPVRRSVPKGRREGNKIIFGR